jgi:hypothetical protein
MYGKFSYHTSNVPGYFLSTFAGDPLNYRITLNYGKLVRT